MDPVLTEKKKVRNEWIGPYEEKKVRNEWIHSLRRKKKYVTNGSTPYGEKKK